MRFTRTLANGQRQERPKDFYTYQFLLNVLAPAAQVSDEIQIEADSDFVVVKMSYLAVNRTVSTTAQTDSTRVIPLITIQITDTGSGRALFNQAEPISTVFGTGWLPFVLPYPRMVKGTSVLRGDFVNFDTAATYDLFLTVIGYKLWPWVNVGGPPRPRPQQQG